MPLYRHPTLTVLRVRPQAAAFLKQYTTNTIDAPASAFLTREGRIVAVVRQMKISDDEAILVIGRTYVERLMTHLSKYLALSETKIEPAGDYAVYFDAGGGQSMKHESEWSIHVSWADPLRGRLIVSPDYSKTATMTEQDYTRFRVEHAIPEQGIDFGDEMPLCVDESLVHFDKGCYLGQEIVARVHYRGNPPKRLVVKKLAECNADESARMTSRSETKGGIAGFVFV